MRQGTAEVHSAQLQEPQLQETQLQEPQQLLSQSDETTPNQASLKIIQQAEQVSATETDSAR